MIYICLLSSLCSTFWFLFIKDDDIWEHRKESLWLHGIRALGYESCRTEWNDYSAELCWGRPYIEIKETKLMAALPVQMSPLAPTSYPVEKKTPHLWLRDSYLGPPRDLLVSLIPSAPHQLSLMAKDRKAYRLHGNKSQCAILKGSHYPLRPWMKQIIGNN